MKGNKVLLFSFIIFSFIFNNAFGVPLSKQQKRRAFSLLLQCSQKRPEIPLSSLVLPGIDPRSDANFIIRSQIATLVVEPSHDYLSFNGLGVNAECLAVIYNFIFINKLYARLQTLQFSEKDEKIENIEALQRTLDSFVRLGVNVDLSGNLCSLIGITIGAPVGVRSMGTTASRAGCYGAVGTRFFPAIPASVICCAFCAEGFGTACYDTCVKPTGTCKGCCQCCEGKCCCHKPMPKPYCSIM